VQDLINRLGQLTRNGAIDRGTIQDAQRALQAAQVGQRFSGDPAEIQKITQQILDSVHKVEGELAKSLQLLVEKDKIRAAQEDEIPAAYQNEVKAYYEAVGKQK
jgi:hypothetical protein